MLTGFLRSSQGTYDIQDARASLTVQSPQRHSTIVLVPIAITRAVSRAIASCELTHIDRVSIDVASARAQHAAYEAALASSGYEIRCLPEEADLPDSVFVEDTAVILPDAAIITRPGAESRRRETASVAAALEGLRPLLHVEEPGTLDGGDVLLLDREIAVGRTGRSNAEGIAQLRRMVAPFGFAVREIPVAGALHLKTAVTRVAERVLLVNPRWVDHRVHFADWIVIHVDEAEPFAANALWIERAGEVIHSASFPLTAARLSCAGIRVHPVVADELGKAEGGVTCCSLLLE